MWMTMPVTLAHRRRIEKLSRVLPTLPQTRHGLSITRLRVVEGLCETPEAARSFAWFLATRALERFDAEPPGSLDEDARARHRSLMVEALARMREAEGLSAESLAALRAQTQRLRVEQSEHKDVPYGSVRLISNRWLLQVEESLSCFVGAHPGSPYWAYRAARTFAEEHDSSYGAGLTPRSAPALAAIVSFWTHFYECPDATLTPHSR